MAHAGLYIQAVNGGSGILTYTFSGTGSADGIVSRASLKMMAFSVNIDGDYNRKQAVVKMVLKSEGNPAATDTFRLLVSPFSISPNNIIAEKVFVSFTSGADIRNAFINGLEGVAVIEPSSAHPLVVRLRSFARFSGNSYS